MDTFNIVLWSILAYLFVGIVVASRQDREQGCWICTVVLWPLQIASKY